MKAIRLFHYGFSFTQKVFLDTVCSCSGSAYSHSKEFYLLKLVTAPKKFPRVMVI